MEDDRLLNLIKNLNYLLGTLEKISAQKLLEYVPHSEYSDIYIRFEFGKNIDIVFSLFNANTKCTVKKIYPLSEILKKCTNLLTTMEFMHNDSINLYIKSKERVFYENAVLSI